MSSVSMGCIENRHKAHAQIVCCSLPVRVMTPKGEPGQCILKDAVEALYSKTYAYSKGLVSVLYWYQVPCISHNLIHGNQY